MMWCCLGILRRARVLGVAPLFGGEGKWFMFIHLLIEAELNVALMLCFRAILIYS